MITTKRPQAYDNLINTGDLKEAVSNPLSIRQYIKTAEGLLNDARTDGLTAHGRYALAYEGLFCVVMATLEHFGARPGDGEGHRVIAIQRAAADLDLDPQEFSSVMKIHSDRNRATYRTPIPPVTKEQADLVNLLLDTMLKKARPLLAAHLSASSAANKGP